jgi:hypothetical protein
MSCRPAGEGVRGVRLVALAALGLLLAGCSSPAAPPVVEEKGPVLPGTLFASVRHCTAVDFYAQAVVPGLDGMVPAGWSTPTPGVADLRIVLWRCVDTMAMLLTVALKTGSATDATAPVVDYVLQVLTNSTVDDWETMGAPVTRAVCTYSSEAGADVWTVTTPEPAVRLEVDPVGDRGGSQHDAVEQYAAGDPVQWSWAWEKATITRAVQGDVSFGPASVLSNAQVLAPLGGTASERWAAVNAEFRTGLAP